MLYSALSDDAVLDFFGVGCGFFMENISACCTSSLAFAAVDDDKKAAMGNDFGADSVFVLSASPMDRSFSCGVDFRWINGSGYYGAYRNGTNFMVAVAFCVACYPAVFISSCKTSASIWHYSDALLCF